MSGLFDSLSVASTALAAQRMGMDVVGQNLANVNTEGFSRRQVVLSERPATDVNSAGRGVTVSEIRALRDTYIQSRLRTEQPGTSRDATIVDALSVAEAALGEAGSSVDASLDQFFTAFSSLSENPSSSELRDGVVRQGEALAQMFHDVADRLQRVGTDANAAIVGSVDEINRLALQVAQYNGEVVSANGRDVTTLVDARDVILQKLSKLADVQASARGDGAIDVSIGNGRALVVGGDATRVEVTNEPVTGRTLVLLNGSDISGEIAGGSIAGHMAVRDHFVPDYLAKLDALAHGLGHAVNDAHRNGYDGRGDAGADFFDVADDVDGAAFSIALNAAVHDDAQLVAASATGASGDNGVARQIAALRDTRVFEGGTATAANMWGRLVYAVGADSASAVTSRDGRQAVLDQLNRLRDAASGVSLDEEAASLMKFQRAYEANARYFVTITRAIDALMDMVH